MPVPPTPEGTGNPTPDGYRVADTIAHLARRAEAERRDAAVRAARLRAATLPAAAALRTLGADRVWLFGSLAAGAPHLASDVDLAVEGLAPDRWVEALGVLSRLVPGEVDLVRIEEAPASLRERILAEGEPL